MDKLSTSEITLTITIQHEDNLEGGREAAQAIAASIARMTAARFLAIAPITAYQFGRVASVGPEDGPSVSTFIQSAFIVVKGE